MAPRTPLAVDVRAAVLAGAIVAVPALLAILSGRLLLFASLGPTAVMLAHSPDQRSSRVYSIVVSHLVGAGCAMAAVVALGLASAPSVFEAGTVSPARLAATVIALAVATLIELRARATHVPAASTTLLVALGSFTPTLHDFLLIAIGVITVALVGVPARKLAGLSRRDARSPAGSVDNRGAAA